MKYCPKCRTEYEDWITVCADCKAPLVLELPQEPKPIKVKLVRVFATGNQTLLAMAKSVLEKAEIKYIVKNEGVQDLFGVGRIGIGYNPIVGPAEIQVDKNDEQTAKDLLKDLTESKGA